MTKKTYQHPQTRVLRMDEQLLSGIKIGSRETDTYDNGYGGAKEEDWEEETTEWE